LFKVDADLAMFNEMLERLSSAGKVTLWFLFHSVQWEKVKVDQSFTYSSLVEALSKIISEDIAREGPYELRREKILLFKENRENDGN